MLILSILVKFGIKMNTSAREILASGASELGITLSDRQLDMFDRFTELLIEWNQKFNLTRITDPVEIAVKHHLDSLSLLKFVEVPADSSIIDVGTGAGFPAIPLKIVLPEIKVVMLDSVRKKLSFIEAVIADLGLHDAKVIHSRAEDLGREKTQRDKYDFAVSRAVAKLSVLAEFCIPFCRLGGRFVAYKGPDADEEVAKSLKAISLLGGDLEHVHRFTLPHSDQQRTLVVVKKNRSTPRLYPRKAGIPEQKPL